jgi:hypothetical protein
LVLKAVDNNKIICTTWKYGAGEGYRRAVGPIVREMKYYIES